MDGLRGRFDRFVGRGAPRDRFADSERWFTDTADVFLRYLKRFDVLTMPEAVDGAAVGVLIAPWVCTPVPWYSIMLAIGLARRGRKVVLLWDDTGFSEPHVDEQNRTIAGVLAHVGQHLPVVRLSHQQPFPASDADGRALQRLSGQNVTWSLRGATPAGRDLPLVRAIEASLARSLPLVRSALRQEIFDFLLVPGGVYGTSGVVLLAAEELGCRVATFDADRHVAQLCVDGVAAQNADLARAFDTLWNSGPETKRNAIATARSEFESRAEASDRYGYQTVPTQAPKAGGVAGVLMPLNVEWDTAALGKHGSFTSTIDWITSTIRVILDMDAGPVIVRQHPSERRPRQRSELDIAQILRDQFGDEGRCRFIAAEDSVNSYDLLRSARLVLPFTSNIGIEAAAIGKPVLVSGAAYYADLGFVWSPDSRDDYFALLRRGLGGDLEPMLDQSDRAWICYYLSAVRNRIWTDFTPQPDDFWSWCGRAPESLFAEPEVSDMLEAIDTDVPVSLLRHRRATAGMPQ